MLDTQRFLKAQDDYYETALREMKNGRKQSHWIWFIFPQLKALGRSPTARYYGIESLEDARAYLEEPTLRSRLLEITGVILAHKESDPIRLMGQPIDALKLRSSMTLFGKAAPQETLFGLVLEKYFDSTPDRHTLSLLASEE
ncbi:MAG: DUF1810 domain-containing protein [Clostridia bacterium]|nr:DUF1810 domain-containing protein [Clostridia bacterium]